MLLSPSGYGGCCTYACRDTSNVRNRNTVLFDYTVRHGLHDDIKERWHRVPHAEEKQDTYNWQVAALQGWLLFNLGQERGELLPS